MLRLLHFFFFCIALLPLSAQKIKIEVRLDSMNILIGQQVALRTVITCPKNAHIAYPQYAQDTIVDGVEIIERSKIDTLVSEDGKYWQLHRSYTLTAFDSAVYLLPRFEVKMGEKNYAAAHQLFLKVGYPALDKNNPEQLRVPHAPVEAAFRWSAQVPLLLLLLHLLLIFLLWAVYRVSNKKLSFKKVWVYPPPPIHQVALTHIEDLRQQSYVPTDAKPHFMSLSENLREYLKARFKFQATEMTSREIMAHLAQHDDGFDFAQHRPALHRFFEVSDWVKFAKYPAELSEWQQSLDTAQNYVNATKIEDPEALRPTLQEVPYEAQMQLYLRRAFLVGGILAVLAMTAVVVTVLILMWQNFM